MTQELHKTLGEAKSHELAVKSWRLWTMLELSESRKSAQVGGTVLEGIAKDFIREFLPAGFGVKSGLIFDAKAKQMSPQVDAIIYRGVPLLEFTDVVVVEKEQVRAVFEIKSWVSQTNIFGEKKGRTRDSSTGLAYAYNRRKDFLPADASYILFTFELHSGSTDAEVLKRLNQICDSYAVVIRKAGRTEVYDFDNSISKLIEWLRNLT